MRIGIDATWAGRVGTGTASYTAGLIDALLDEPHEFVLYFRRVDSGRNPLFDRSAANLTKRVVEGWGQPGRSLGALALAAVHDHLDLFHSPAYFLPLWPGPKVVTFHDLNMFLQWRAWWRPGMRAGWLSMSAQTVLSAVTARCIVTDSQFAAASLRTVLRIGTDRLRVIYPGVDEVFFKLPEVDVHDDVRQRHALRRFVLSVGVLSPQKNLEGIIRSFSLMDAPDLQLALVGRADGPYFHSVIEPLVQRLRLVDRVVHLGVVPRPDLVQLYRSAELLIFPSFGEGFGLPPLEAMACRLPVVASSASSLPEVLGDAAILVDPADTGSLAEAMARVMHNQELRARLVESGLKRAGRFRWSRAAKATCELYESLR